MTDREYLELAYRAYAPGENYIRMVNVAGVDYWNPLTDDGDALRLAVALNLAVSVEANFGSTQVLWGPPVDQFRVMHNGDPYAATRRAIVRAAAEIGKGTKPFPTAKEIREEWT